MTERSQDVNIIGDGETAITSTTDGSKERLDVNARRDNVSTGTYNAVSVGSTATLIAASNSDRITLQFQNLEAERVFWGFDSSVTTSNGMELGLRDVQIITQYTGTIYGVVASGTADVRVVEF